MFFLLSLSLPARAAELIVDRNNRSLTVVQNGKELSHCIIGIGRGGYGNKKSMDDFVTPAGQFVVDLVLYKKLEFNQISRTLQERYKEEQRSKYTRDKGGLLKLFKNMNGIDFNHDGKADAAYGIAYIGLEGVYEPSGKQGFLNKLKPLTGPKLSNYRGRVYWYSIALHGCPDEATHIGKADSGGCVHVPATELEKLIETGTVQIGTKVLIR